MVFFWWNLPNRKWEPILFKLEKLVKLMKLVKLDWRFRLQFGFRSVWFLSIDIYWIFSVFKRVQLDIFRRFWWTWPNWKLAVVLVKLASWWQLFEEFWIAGDFARQKCFIRENQVTTGRRNGSAFPLPDSGLLLRLFWDFLQIIFSILFSDKLCLAKRKREKSPRFVPLIQYLPLK